MTLAKCGAIDASLQMMSSSLQDEYKLSIFSWTSVISACAGCGRSSEALELHNLMLTHGVEPDKYTFVSLFKACAKAMNLEEGKRLHDVAGQQRPSVVSDVFVCNSLISMYGKCGACHEAEEVFLSMPSHTTVSWNAMLSSYVWNSASEKAIKLYRQMHEEGVNANPLPRCSYISQNRSSFLYEETTSTDSKFLPNFVRDGMSDIHGLPKCRISRDFFPLLFAMGR